MYQNQPPNINNYYQNVYFDPKKIQLDAEKADIRKGARIVAIPLLILVLLMRLWSIPYLYIMQALGFTQEEAINLVSNSGAMEILQVALSVTFFIIPFFIATKATGKEIGKLIPFNAPQKGIILPFFLLGVGFCAFSNIAVSIAGGIFESMGFDYNYSAGETPTGILGFVLSVIATAIVPALAEEFACRGIIHGMLEKYGEGFAIIVTSILFGCMHGNFRQIPFAFLVGLILGYIRVKTGSIWICILVHAVNNFVSVILSSLDGVITNATQSIIYVSYLTLSLMAGILGLVMLKKWKGDFYSFKNVESTCSEKQKYKWFFTSVLVIIFLAICFIESLQYF